MATELASQTALVTVEAVVIRADGRREPLPPSVTPVTDPTLIARIRAMLNYPKES